MAQRAGGDAAEHVEVAPAIGVPNVEPLPTHQGDGLLFVVGCEELLAERDGFCVVHRMYLLESSSFMNGSSRART